MRSYHKTVFMPSPSDYGWSAAPTCSHWTAIAVTGTIGLFLRKRFPHMATTSSPHHHGESDPSSIKGAFLRHLSASVESASFIRLTLGKAVRGSELERVVVSPVTTKSGNALSFKFKSAKREETKNCSIGDALVRIDTLVPGTFLSATLFTTEKDFTLQYSKKGEPSSRASKPSLKTAPSLEHNRKKNYLIGESEPFLYHLGITSLDGKVRPDRYDKFRQINKFVEIIDSLVKEANISSEEPLEAVDYGSGKNYLTFALYDYLVRQRAFKARVVGVETRADLVEHGNNAATAAGFDDLAFEQGAIASSSRRGDLVVALHACDTATDDALAKAIEGGASIIAVAPCCQKYVRPRMTVPPNLAPIFKHGIVEERLAESLTNGLRALTLEAFGYHTKVFEFIGGEHTAKNVMITATRRNVPRRTDARKIEEINDIKKTFSLPDFYLDRVIRLDAEEQFRF